MIAVIEGPAKDHAVTQSTLRARRHRGRRCERLRLFTVEVPEDLIDCVSRAGAYQRLPAKWQSENNAALIQPPFWLSVACTNAQPLF